MLAVGCHGHHPPPAPVTRAEAPIVTPDHAILALDATQRRERLQHVLDAYRARGGMPGAVLAARFGDNTTIAVALGFADRERGTPMTADARMLAGGVAPTFFAALALELAREGRLALDTPITVYLHGVPWLRRLPNAQRVTPRMLLLQTSGYGGFSKTFYDALGRDPLRPREHVEMLRSLFETAPRGQPGERFEASALDYDLLAMIEEAITHDDPYAEIERRFLRRYGLRETTPALSPRLAGLVPGYTGPVSPVGNALTGEGTLIVNPQFEWAAGGFVSTGGDLARWIAAYCRGEVVPPREWAEVIRGDGVPAPAFGPGVRWGLGLTIEHTALGPAFGTRGFFPGYMSEARWYRDINVAIAIQVNTSDPDALPGWAAGVVLDEAAQALTRQ